MTRSSNWRRTITICVFLIFLSCGSTTPQPANSGKGSNVKPQETEQALEKEQAIGTARKDALTKYDSLDRFNLIVCETARIWLIIFDGGGPEYVISKESGLILGRKEIPQGSEVSNQAGSSSRIITEQEAIEIAKQQIHTNYGLTMDEFNVFACELGKAWSITFEYREVPGVLLPNSRSPFYVIDKLTGKVIYKEG